MKNLFFIPIIFCSFLKLGHAQSWRESLVQKLPSQVQKIIPGKTTLSEMNTILGKENLKERDKYYYELYGFKYALEVTLEKEKVTKIHYTFTGVKPDLKSLPKKIDIKKLKPVTLKSGTVSSRYLKEVHAKGSFVVDLSSKTIESVELK